MGAYCKFCDRRCFVERVLPDDALLWPGQKLHLATCAGGMDHDRAHLGYDQTSAINPYAYLTDTEVEATPHESARNDHHV